MDTKWKNRKKVISFMVFFLGVSLTFGSVVEIWKNKPYGVKLYEPGKIFEKDYRNSERFREYMANRLNNFLVIAAGGAEISDMWIYEEWYGTGAAYDTFNYAEVVQGSDYADSSATVCEDWMSEQEAQDYYNSAETYGMDKGKN